jgi:hypothetical protein
MGNLIRRKTVNLDGAEFVISCLTQRALEDFKAEEAKLENQADAILTFRRKVIAYAMNRALPELAEDAKYTEEKLKDILDLGSITPLFHEVLAFSGIQLATKAAPDAEAGASGETSPSSTS